MELIGRTKEAALLKEYAESQQAEFIAVYGRRRVGKTFLLGKVFSDDFVFETSGVINGSRDSQFAAFNQSLLRIGYTGPYVNKWMDAFFALEQTLTPRLDKKKRQVIFIDELPCLDVKRTQFVVALGHFWNSWVSKHDNLMLVVCGSATSWMVDKVINNRGGLHNRVTHTMHLHPYTLAQCEEYCHARNMSWDRLAITQAYMVFGGVPYYLSLIKREESVAEAIDRLLFAEQGELRDEYERLFSSLFQNPEPYMAIIRALATHRYGLTRDELARELSKSDGGGLTTLLENLEKCDFIRYHRVRIKKVSKTGGYYTLADFFAQFHYSFMEGQPNDAHYWMHNLISPRINTFYGLAFERVCMAHIPQIKKAIGIDQIGTEYYSWRSNDPTQGAQVDLLIERADRIINLCEIKYSSGPYAIDKEEDMKFRIRQSAFVAQTGTRYGIQPTMISPYGLTRNTYYYTMQKLITLDDLFQS